MNVVLAAFADTLAAELARLSLLLSRQPCHRKEGTQVGSGALAMRPWINSSTTGKRDRSTGRDIHMHWPFLAQAMGDRVVQLCGVAIVFVTSC